MSRSSLSPLASACRFAAELVIVALSVHSLAGCGGGSSSGGTSTTGGSTPFKHARYTRVARKAALALRTLRAQRLNAGGALTSRSLYRVATRIVHLSHAADWIAASKSSRRFAKVHTRPFIVRPTGLRTRDTTTSGVYSPFGVPLYYTLTTSDNGTMKMEFFTDEAHTQSAGAMTFGAPKWTNDQTGNYPEILTVHYDKWLYSTSGTTTITMNDASGTSAHIAGQMTYDWGGSSMESSNVRPQ